MGYLIASGFIIYGLAFIFFARKIQRWVVQANDAVFGKYNFLRDWQGSESYAYMLRCMGIVAVVVGTLVLYHFLTGRAH